MRNENDVGGVVTRKLGAMRVECKVFKVRNLTRSRRFADVAITFQVRNRYDVLLPAGLALRIATRNAKVCEKAQIVKKSLLYVHVRSRQTFGRDGFSQVICAIVACNGGLCFRVRAHHAIPSAEIFGSPRHFFLLCMFAFRGISSGGDGRV
jgi:hypothetical protein